MDHRLLPCKQSYFYRSQHIYICSQGYCRHTCILMLHITGISEELSSEVLIICLIVIFFHRRERQLKLVNSKKRVIKSELKARANAVEKVLSTHPASKLQSSSW